MAKQLTINDYEITKDGQVINKHTHRILKPQPNGKGYLRVSIAGKLQFVHRLVAELYIPNPERKTQVNHKDGNKLNNCVDNLEWVTNQENRNHALEHGLHLCGEACPGAKLSEEDVIFIRKHPEISSEIYANMFNISPRTVDDVKSYRIWKQLKRYAELSQNQEVEE